MMLEGRREGGREGGKSRGLDFCLFKREGEGEFFCLEEKVVNVRV